MSVVANVALNIDSRGATQSLRAVQQGAQATDNAVSGLLKTVGKLAIALGAIQAVKFVFAKTAELESQTRSLEVLTGSAVKAKQIIQELQQLGAVTPFTSTELIDAAKRLQAFGVEGDKVVETTRRLADVSGATGAELQGLVTAYGQVQAKGRLQGEELLQFQERGIALQGELQKMYGLSGEELRKALEKGRIGAEAVEVAIIRLTNAGGKYANGAIAQSDTLGGRFSTLMDSIEMLAKKIGQILEPAFKAVLNIAIGIVDQINKALAGPDYKKANNQLFNTRSEIIKLKKEIAAAEQAGISETTRSAPVLGVDGQVVAGGGMVLPEMRAELNQLEQQAIRLDNRLKELRNQSKAKPVTTTPAVPALLPEKPKAAKIPSIDELLGGVIKRENLEQKSALELAKQKELNLTIGKKGAELSRINIDYAYKEKEALIDIASLQETLVKLEGLKLSIKSKILKDDKFGQAIITRENDLRTQVSLMQKGILVTRVKKEGEILKLQQQQNENNQQNFESSVGLFKKQTAQVNNQTQAFKLRNRLQMEGVKPEQIEGKLQELAISQQLNAELITFDESLAAGTITQTQYAEQTNAIRLAAEGAAIAIQTYTVATVAAASPIQQFIASSTTQLNDLESVAVRVSQGIGDAVGNAMANGIQGLVEGTKTVEQVFADFLKTIGDILMQEGTKMIATYTAIAIAKSLAGLFGGGSSAIAGGSTYGGAASSSIFSAGTGTAFGGMSIPGFAEGGRPPVGKASLVGEKGPELFVPSSSGTIIPADATAAMARYQRQGGGSGSGNSSSDAMGDGAAATPVLSMSFETTRFLGQDYVSTDQLQAAMMATEKRAAAAGAKAGAAQITSKLQQSPSYRRQVGLR